jgi:hypothetical protein
LRNLVFVYVDLRQLERRTVTELALPGVVRKETVHVESHDALIEARQAGRIGAGDRGIIGIRHHTGQHRMRTLCLCRGTNRQKQEGKH